jgi:hypothetical protein
MSVALLKLIFDDWLAVINLYRSAIYLFLKITVPIKGLRILRKYCLQHLK